MKPLKYISILLLCNFCSFAFTQDNSMQQLIRGKKFFWEAKFDDAIATLNNVLANPDSKTEFLFEANVFIGFISIRRNGPSQEADAYFERAVRLDPARELDEAVIPPDLVSAFKSAREKFYGCVYVTSEPPAAEVAIVKGDSVGIPQPTPARVCDLIGSATQLLIKKEGFDGQLLPLVLTGGVIDSLHVTLDPITVRNTGGGSKLLTWFIRGGVVVSAGTLLYLTIVDNPQEAASGLLPAPPDRPTN